MEPVPSNMSPIPGRLTPYDRLYAPVLLTWVRSDDELFWLAPQTPAPLTLRKIDKWTTERDDPFLFWTDGDPTSPIGYGELNRMPGSDRHLWLGHLIIAPSMRRRGWGGCMMNHLLRVGFQSRRVREISLVVFPDNVGAIRCYERAGLESWGDQHKQFSPSDRPHRMIHMGIRRERYEALKKSACGPEAQ